MTDRIDMLKVCQMIEHNIELGVEVGSTELDLLGLTDAQAGGIKHVSARLPYVKEAIDRLEALSAMEKERASQYVARSKSLANAAKSIKDYLKYQLTLLDINSVDSDGVRVTVRENPPSLKISNEGEIPEKYFRQVVVRELNKDALKRDLQAGEVIAGASVEVGTHIRFSAGTPVTKLK